MPLKASEVTSPLGVTRLGRSNSPSQLAGVFNTMRFAMMSGPPSLVLLVALAAALGVNALLAVSGTRLRAPAV